MNKLNKEQLITFETDIADCFNNAMIKAPVHLYDGNEKQMIDICVVLNGKKVKEEKVEEKVLTSYIMGTKYGTIFSK
mgnify:CR=1 FL=1